MKKALLILSAMISFQAYSLELTKDVLDTVALDIDNICGDTWCEGEFNWNHYDLQCDLNKGTCTMKLELMDEFYMDDNIGAIILGRLEYEGKMMQKYSDLYMDNDTTDRRLIMPYNCTLPGMNTVADVAEIYKGKVTYSQKLYEAVSECVTDAEEIFWARQEKL